MEFFYNDHNAAIVMDIIAAIKYNKVYLSDIDGLIGDGDHGINMNKGFTMAGECISSQDSFASAMRILGDTLLLEIGGSMGPIYGTFFSKCASVVKGKTEINGVLFAYMLESALAGVKDVGGAKMGDKTLVDTMEPSILAFKEMLEKGKTFREALEGATIAAEGGKESTKNMIAKVGRAARLGERSVGVLDAGAVSCYIILKAMFKSVTSLLI